MFTQAARKPKLVHTASELLTLKPYENNEALLEKRAAKPSISDFKANVTRESDNQTFQLINSTPTKNPEEIINHIGEKAASHFSQLLIIPPLINYYYRTELTPQADIKSCSMHVIYDNDEGTNNNKMTTVLNTVYITLDRNNPWNSPSQRIFLPGSVTVHRKFINEKKHVLKDGTHELEIVEENYYLIESIEYSNSILKKLYEGKIPVNEVSLDAAINAALLEESEESQYQYFKTVLANISSSNFTDKLQKNTKALEEYRLKHLKRILQFLTHTSLYIDDHFKENLKNLAGQITNLNQKIDSKTYNSLQQFLNSNPPVSYWPLKNIIKPTDKTLIKYNNPSTETLRKKGWVNTSPTPGEDFFSECLNIKRTIINQGNINITLDFSKTPHYQTVNGKVCHVTTISDIKINYQYLNKPQKSIPIPGTARIIFDNETDQLISIESSNTAIINLIAKDHSKHLEDEEYYHDISKNAHVEEFKNNFTDFRKALNNSTMITLVKLTDDFINSINNIKMVSNKNYLELESMLNSYLHDLRQKLREHVQNDDISTLEKLLAEITKSSHGFRKELKGKMTIGWGLSINDDKINEFLNLATLKATQEFTNQTIYNIAMNGMRHANEDINKAYSNMNLATKLFEKSTVFYQKKPNYYTKMNVQSFFKDNFINTIKAEEPYLDILRNTWDSPLRNAAAFILTCGLWGLAMVGKAIYSAITGTEAGRKFFGVTEQASPFFFTHAKSYEVAHQGANEAEKLEQSLETLVTPKLTPRNSNKND